MTDSIDRKAVIDIKQAESLLFPIVVLLRMSGLSKEAIKSSLSLAYRQASKSIQGRKIKHIRHSTRYTDIVSLWTHDKRFLDTKGQPRPLKLHGTDGLASLVRSAAPEADPLDVLAVLKRFKTVRHIKGGQYKLTKPFFISATPGSLALEPTIRFLTDATTTLSGILTRTEQSRSPDVFWRNVDNHQLSIAAAKGFIAFARERSLTFLEELDDWLEAHSGRKKTKTKHRYHRVGLGIFSIHSKQRS